MYLAIRLIREKRGTKFYVAWILSTSLVYLWFLVVKIHLFDDFPALYRIFQPVFFLGPPCLFLHFVTKLKMRIKPIDYVIHLIPVVVSVFITAKVVIYQLPLFNSQIKHFQLQIDNYQYVNDGMIFHTEAIMHALRLLFTMVYFTIIHRLINQSTNERLKDYWIRIFLPIRINVILMFIVFVLPVLLKIVFQLQYPQYYLIIPSMMIATFLFFWHVLMSIKNLENSIELPVEETRKDLPQQVLLANIPVELMNAINQIYNEKMYLNPIFGIQDIAPNHGYNDQKFSHEFNKYLPFTFTSFVNYLRLKYYKDNHNDKFSVEANISNAGFNSRASYYQWLKREEKLDTILQPYLSLLDQSYNPVTPTD
jgi:hypothetical protein